MLVGYLLVAVVVLPALCAAVVATIGHRHAETGGRIAIGGTGVSFLLATALAGVVWLDGPVSAVVERSDGRAVVGLTADQVGVLLLLLITGVSVVTQAFARRYLRGDPRARRFFLATGLLTAASSAMVTSATLIGLAVMWTLAGVALCVLLGLYSPLPAARDGVRRTARAFLIGDTALWTAVILATVRWGTLDLRQLSAPTEAALTDPATLLVVSCLLVVAALARSAQLPLQRWLPATLAAPTPVSALLHAGVVNAGGVLLVRTSPIFGASPAATHLAFVAGAATAVYGTAVMLTKPDVKGALAHSTMGQMGFMIMTCGLGWYAAAVFHLVAHGMYKATLFLGSGSAVHEQVRDRTAPPVPDRGGRAIGLAAAIAAAAPAAALVGSAMVLHPAAGGSPDAQLLLTFAWASGAWATWGWLRRHPGPRGIGVAIGAALLLAPLYVGLVAGITSFLAPALTGAGHAAVSPWLLVVVLAAMLGLTVIRFGAAHPRLRELHRTVYVLALSAGRVGGRSARPHPAAAVTARLLPIRLLPGLRGTR
ncbi:MAG: proton-conducting transporter membrane subunit [Nakamurella sp.]